MSNIDESNDKVLIETDWYTIKETDDDYEYLETQGGVIILLVRENNGNIEFLFRYEQGISGKSVTVITGRTDEGESTLETAQRELQEEAGIVVSNTDGFIEVGDIFYRKSDITPDVGVIVVLDDFEEQEPTTDGTSYEKESENFWVPVENLGDLIDVAEDSALLAILAKLYSVMDDIFA